MNPHFLTLVAGLSHQAEAALAGQVPEGAGDAREIGRMLIDTLAMLEQKMAGNLEPDERQLLTQTLTSLRVAFVKGASR